MTRKEQALAYITQKDWTGMHQMLRRMSSMEFRKMEGMLRNEILTELSNEIFWETLLYLILYKRQAFISGVIAIEHLVKDGTLSFDNTHTEQLCRHLSETNRESLVKMCNMMIPMLHSEEQIAGMFRAFRIESGTARLSILLKAESQIAYFALFKDLKLHDDAELTRKCYFAILKKGDDMAYNMCCLLKNYFALDGLPQRFSLSIEQYELSHIDRDFSTFSHILTGKRPKI